MKKIICTICGISLLTSAALAQERTSSTLTSAALAEERILSTVEPDMTIKWYEPAVIEAVACIIGLSGESSEAAQKKAALYLSHNFRVANGVVMASTAGLTAICVHVLYNQFENETEEMDRLCAEMVIDAIRKHNKIATELSKIEQKWDPYAVNSAFAFQGLNARDVRDFAFITFSNDLTDRIDKFLADRSYIISEDQLHRYCTVFAGEAIQNSKNYDGLWEVLELLHMNNTRKICNKYIYNLKILQRQRLQKSNR